MPASDIIGVRDAEGGGVRFSGTLLPDGRQQSLERNTARRLSEPAEPAGGGGNMCECHVIIHSFTQNSSADPNLIL